MKKRDLAQQGQIEKSYDPQFQEKQVLLKDEMKVFVNMHYQLKEKMMDFFLKYL
jgi:hypothetical protein